MRGIATAGDAHQATMEGEVCSRAPGSWAQDRGRANCICDAARPCPAAASTPQAVFQARLQSPALLGRRARAGPSLGCSGIRQPTLQRRVEIAQAGGRYDAQAIQVAPLRAQLYSLVQQVPRAAPLAPLQRRLGVSAQLRGAAVRGAGRGGLNGARERGAARGAAHTWQRAPGLRWPAFGPAAGPSFRPTSFTRELSSSPDIYSSLYRSRPLRAFG
jgi:hypothetical protein